MKVGKIETRFLARQRSQNQLSIGNFDLIKHSMFLLRFIENLRLYSACERDRINYMNNDLSMSSLRLTQAVNSKIYFKITVYACI